MRPALARSLAAAACLGLAAVATWPLLATPVTRLVGHPDVDVTNHAWGPWWWWITLGRGGVPWETTLLATPRGGVLWFIDPFLAGVGATMVGLVGLVGAYNLVILLYVALAAASGRSLARAFGASERAAWVAAAAVATSPYLLCEIHNGVSEAVGVCWSTFALAAARRALAAPGPDVDRARWLRAWGVTGLWLAAAAAGTWYYGLATGLTIGAWALAAARPAPGTPPSERRERLRAHVGGAVLAGAVGVVVSSPVLALVHASISDPASLVVRGDVSDAVRDFLLAHNAVDPLAFVAPLGFQSVDLAARGEAFLHSSYLGLVALALAAYALRARPALRLVALGLVPAAVLSLGAYLWMGGGWVTVASFRLPLPFAALVAILPDAGSTHAQRLVWPVVATVAALAAVGIDALALGRARFGLVAFALVADLLAASPWPLARVEPLDLRAHAALVAANRVPPVDHPGEAHDDGLPPAQGVLDLPAEVGNTMATSRYLVYQSASELPIPYRPDARGGTSSLFGEPWFQLLYAMSVTREDQLEGMRGELTGIQYVDLRSTKELGIRWIVLHRELERGRGDIARLEAQLREWFGAPVTLGPHLTWDVTRRRDDGGHVLSPP
jgi:hypothetical protein